MAVRRPAWGGWALCDVLCSVAPALPVVDDGGTRRTTSRESS